MAKVVLVNGSPNEGGCTATALREVARALEENGVGTETVWLGKAPMQDCVACFKCQQDGRCVFDDKVNELGARIGAFDGIVVGSPVYYGGPNGRLTSFLDRLCFSVPSDKLAGMFAASVVSCRRGGGTAAFERLNQYFLMLNMHVVSSQYWNQVHGYTPDDVRKDAEGLQTMRTLGRNMAWLVKSKEAAAAAGVAAPEHEPVVYTDFIR